MSHAYGFTLEVAGSFDEIVEKTTAALAAEGFGVLTEIDMKATMKKKLDVDRLPYKILGACNPPLAKQALEAEPDIGLLLPCNVMVREQEDGKVIVGFLNPEALFAMVDNSDVAPLAENITGRLNRVADALRG